MTRHIPAAIGRVTPAVGAARTPLVEMTVPAWPLAVEDVLPVL